MHPAGARRTEIASLPLVRCPLQESKTMSKNKMLSRALFAALVGDATFGAQGAEEPGFYLGAGAGQSFVDETGYDDEDTGFHRSAEHTSELQSLMRIQYAVFCLKTKKTEHRST